MRKENLVSDKLRENWIVEDLGDLDFGSHYGDFSDTFNARWSNAVGNANKKIHKIVYRSAKEGVFPLVLGGDSSVSIGTISGILRARPETGVIWLSARPNLHTPSTSRTGFISEMSAALLSRLISPQKIRGFEWMSDTPALRPHKLVYLALRDVEPGEKIAIRESGFKCFTMQEIDKYGLGKVMEMALEHISPRNDLPLHLNCDIDSVDAENSSPSVNQSRAGLSFREAHFVCEFMAETHNLGSMTMVEINSGMHSDAGIRETAKTAANMINSALGDRIL